MTPGAALDALPACPNGHGQMVLTDRRGMASHMAWQGAWYECAPGPLGGTCRSATLIPSGDFAAWLAGQSAGAAPAQLTWST